MFATELSEATHQSFDYNLQLYQEATYTEEHPYGSVMLTEAAANFLKPLIETVCPVTISMDVPQGALDLSLFRKLPLNLAARRHQDLVLHLSSRKASYGPAEEDH